jgi:hypothetical protein
MVATSFLFSLEPVSDCKSLEQPIALWSLTKSQAAAEKDFPVDPKCRVVLKLTGIVSSSCRFPNPELPELPRWPATSLGHFRVELLRPSRFHEASSLEFLDTMGCPETMALHGTNASITFSHPFCHMDGYGPGNFFAYLECIECI